MKARFLSALQRNDADDVEDIVRTSNIDIDTVFDVEDRGRVLAAYKQGNVCQCTVKLISSDWELPQDGSTLQAL